MNEIKITLRKPSCCPYCERPTTDGRIELNEPISTTSLRLKIKCTYYVCYECGVEWTNNNSLIKPIGLNMDKVRFVNSKRNCRNCGIDISDRPEHHFLCYSCWEVKYKPHLKDSNKDNYYNYDKSSKLSNSLYDKPERLKDALEGDEDAYYNLYGEFPSGDDW